MGFNLSYMGTKKQIAPVVAQAINSAQPGIFLDAFSGMCAVGSEIGDKRQVWNNDVQIFSSRVAEALFTSKDLPLPFATAIDILFNNYERNVELLHAANADQLETEREVFESGKLQDILACLDRPSGTTHLTTRPEKCLKHSKLAEANCYDLFTVTYANSYFSLKQCIEIDSIVFAIDKAFESQLISQDHRSWLLISLGRVMRACSNTTGHFAQYLVPNKRNLSRYLRQRHRSIWKEYHGSLATISPIGTVRWRSRNKVFNCNSIELLDTLKITKHLPSVIYADPPYTNDQYSRYYHILETLIRYDYPKVTGKGRYRPDRFQTPFSQKSKVFEAFDSFIRKSANLGSDIVMSYPTNGLLHEIGASPLMFFKKYYSKVEICCEIEHQHSTLGASKGPANTSVTEIIYWATL